VPEILEVELYRQLAERVVDRRIGAVAAPDAWYLKGGVDADLVRAAIVHRHVVGVRRVGKLLLLDVASAPTVGLRFGMTGRLIVDDVAIIEKLEYSSARVEPQWERFAITFEPAGRLVMVDPRRLGGVELDPDEARLGVDALALTRPQTEHLLAGGVGPLKARLMDQSRIAGLGNLLTDEVLWRAGLDPARAAGSLTGRELDALFDALVDTLRTLGARGGSHTGDLHLERRAGGLCPRDGAPLLRRTIAGRTTFSCPVHQH
jgi:formamidopyrimidine-DNA glycosylase